MMSPMTLVLVSNINTVTCTGYGLVLTTLITCSAFSSTGDPLSGEATKDKRK